MKAEPVKSRCRQQDDGQPGIRDYKICSAGLKTPQDLCRSHQPRLRFPRLSLFAYGILVVAVKTVLRCVECVNRRYERGADAVRICS